MQRCTVDLQHSVADIDGVRLKRGAVGVQLQKESARWNLGMRSVRQQVTHRLHNHASRDAVTAVESALQPSADADFWARANNLNGGRIHNAHTRHRGSKRRSFFVCLAREGQIKTREGVDVTGYTEEGHRCCGAGYFLFGRWSAGRT